MSIRPDLLFSPPRLHRAAHGEERKVTWLELFYDLVYVATLIQIGNALSDDVSLGGFLRFAIIFAPIWWAWTGMTFYMNRFVVDDLWHRLLIYAQIVAIALLGVSVVSAFGDLQIQFALAYIAVRLVQVILYVRTWRHEPDTRPLTQRYVVVYLIGIVMWLISIFLPMPVAAILWLAALAIEIGNAFLPHTRALVSLLPPDAEHMRERYGIFVIIVLGESFIKTMSYAFGVVITAQVLIFSLLGILVVFGLWWLYFDDVNERQIRNKNFAPYAWIYAHLPLTLGITAFGVAFKKLFQSLDKATVKPEYALLFGAALALVALALALIEISLSLPKGEKDGKGRIAGRISMAIALGALALVGDNLSAAAFMAIAAAIAVIVIILDEWLARN
jgi:low temperature requirement protein LtrA